MIEQQFNILDIKKPVDAQKNTCADCAWFHPCTALGYITPLEADKKTCGYWKGKE